MKKLSTIIMALVFVLGMAQCKKQKANDNNDSYVGVTKSITFTTGGGSKATIDNSILDELHFLWQDGDKLYVYGSENGTFTDGQYCGSMNIDEGIGSENGIFVGTLDNVPTSGKLRFYHCADALFNDTDKTIAVDLTSQDGTLAGLATKLVACAEVVVKSIDDYSATLEVPYSIVKFDLSAFGTTNIAMTGTTNGGLSYTDKGVKGVTAGTSTTLSGVTSTSTSYCVAVMPESVTTLSFAGGGKVGNKTVTLEENKFYTAAGGAGVAVVGGASTWTNGTNPHPFTVASDRTVNFSQGNLQYIGSTGTWKFADHQFDFLGTTTGQNSTTTTVDRDLFGWGTSNYSHGATCYQPWSTSETNNQYYAYGSGSNNLYSRTPATADWGYNDISNDGSLGANSWRTLKAEEWSYLFNSRTNASNLYGLGQIYSYAFGMIILPDDWTCPAGLSFTPGKSSWANVYSYSEWSKMEAAGAVFLPAASFRKGTSVNNWSGANSLGDYWSSSYSDQNSAFCLSFSSGEILTMTNLPRSHGRSVRLVR